ncbi:MmgE/PrpD family protein [Pararhodobacter sp. SW119]|uniref:MmgE/PrpD family protein n=1 Tax=Pararhodobacter sp. SW119 TaxID=2780075 RepID=UPI001AE07948|nr:MmgE/PrpD family protein [Pararhodobacter sp. SW119]
MDSLSSTLARAIVSSRAEDLNEATLVEARRALVNYLGCALGGAGHPAMDIALRALGQFSGPKNAAVLGRREETDMSLAAFLNGISSHVHDYDDTTPSNYIHPTSPVASALFAYASVRPVSGRDFIHAFVLGFDTVTRIGDATYPAHYKVGWHSTGSIGIFGAAVAIGRLLGLDEKGMLWALGLAATQSSGIRDNFGSMAKAFHPGDAARGGLQAAFLAREGFTTGTTPLEGPRGFAAVTAGGQFDHTGFLDRLGTHFRFEGNTYKPYPCGIVIHPTIELCSSIHAEGVDPARIADVECRVAPLVRDLCDQRPDSGLQGKFSIYHAAAIGLVRGRGGLDEFTDEAVADPELSSMRGKVRATPDPSIGEDAVKVIVRLDDGQEIERFLEGSLGNLRCPLSDAQLAEKFLGQTQGIAGADIHALLARCWRIDDEQDVGDLARSAR